jgi:tetratricopeptide (TPR) repeat protein
MKLKKYEEAIASFDKAVSINGDSLLAWYNKGLVLATLKKYEEALPTYEQAIRIDPDDANIWNAQGVALLELKKYKEAITSFDRALRINPEHPRARENRYTAQQRLQESIRKQERTGNN